MENNICYEQAKPVERKHLIRLVSLALLAISALLMFMVSFSIGFAVSVDDWSSRGIYSMKTIGNCVGAVETIASEILGEKTTLDGRYSVRLALRPGRLTEDLRVLERKLMESVPGIVRIYSVKVDGQHVGWVSEPSEIGEILLTALSSRSTVSTISASFDQEITMDYSYAGAQTPVDAMKVAERVLDLVSVTIVNLDPEEAVPTSAEGIVLE